MPYESLISKGRIPSVVFRDLISIDPVSLATVRYYGILIEDVS